MAHIQVHMAAIQRPEDQQLMQMNPQAQAIMAAAMAHINEHIAFEYRKQVEMAMGMPLHPKTRTTNPSSWPPKWPTRLRCWPHKPHNNCCKETRQQAQQMQAQQKMQDPIVQMQMQELQLKQQDLQLKQQKQQIDAAAKADQLEIEKARIEAQ
jgi:hypothetical protein